MVLGIARRQSKNLLANTQEGRALAKAAPVKRKIFDAASDS